MCHSSLLLRRTPYPGATDQADEKGGGAGGVNYTGHKEEGELSQTGAKLLENQGFSSTKSRTTANLHCVYIRIWWDLPKRNYFLDTLNGS